MKAERAGHYQPRFPKVLTVRSDGPSAGGGQPVDRKWSEGWGKKPSKYELQVGIKALENIAARHGQTLWDPNLIWCVNASMPILYFLNRKVTITGFCAGSGIHPPTREALEEQGAKMLFIAIIRDMISGDFIDDNGTLPVNEANRRKAQAFDSAFRIFHGNRTITREDLRADQEIADRFLAIEDDDALLDVMSLDNVRLIGAMTKDIRASRMRVAIATAMASFNPAWGTQPTDQELIDASNFALRIGKEAGAQIADLIVAEDINLLALYLVDKEFTLTTLVYCQAKHEALHRKIQSEEFFAQLMRDLLIEEQTDVA